LELFENVTRVRFSETVF